MALIVESLGKLQVVTLEGRLATEVAQELKNEFEAYAEGTPGQTLLDMTGVKYMSSYLVGILVALRTRLSKQGYEVHIAGIDPRHLLVLKVSGLDGLFCYHATRADGIAALRAGG